MIIQEHLQIKYATDPSFIREVLNCMPERVDCTLHLTRQRILGKVSADRDSFLPANILRNCRGGDRVLVIDSETDLPDNWRDIDLNELLTEVNDDLALAGRSGSESDNGLSDGGFSSSDGASSDGGTSDEVSKQYHKCGQVQTPLRIQ